MVKSKPYLTKEEINEFKKFLSKVKKDVFDKIGYSTTTLGLERFYEKYKSRNPSLVRTIQRNAERYADELNKYSYVLKEPGTAKIFRDVKRRLGKIATYKSI
ncbi:MAG: hypothetical protein QW622_03325 [Candidatus Pacearchaeota archaeon]